MSAWHDLTHAAFWLELARGDLASWIQLTPYAYAAFEGIHLVGVAFFFGSIFLLDLRLLGLAPQLRPGAAGRFLLRISLPAFVVLAASGLLLFVPSADRYAASPVFHLKLCAIAAGGLNALAFHIATRRHSGVDGEPVWVPWTARTTALVSVLVWVSVIALGRWMGYERRETPDVDFDTLPRFDGR